MSPHTRHNGHDKYRSRIDSLLKSYVAISGESTPESQAHSAKYLAVLVSGYLEQAVKEILLNYASSGSKRQIVRYMEESWPKSRNMNVENIKVILGQFNSTWSDGFTVWLKEKDNRKNDINSIVSWRNSIAHGQEAKTTGVTLVSVRSAFSTIRDLVLFIDSMVKS